MHGTQNPRRPSVGLVAVAPAVVLGGGAVAAAPLFLAGLADQVIQRLIELLQSVPTIPVWLALSAALPRDWTPGAGVLRDHGDPVPDRLDDAWRARFAAASGTVREEDFVLAAELAGCSRARHHPAPHGADLPEPHHRHQSSLAIPAMIINETSLSFLGLGHQAACHQLGRAAAGGAEHPDAGACAVAADPRTASVIVTVLAFNLVGDGLRDASDPYSGRSNVSRSAPPAQSVRDLLASASRLDEGLRSRARRRRELRRHARPRGAESSAKAAAARA